MRRKFAIVYLALLWTLALHLALIKKPTFPGFMLFDDTDSFAGPGPGPKITSGTDDGYDTDYVAVPCGTDFTKPCPKEQPKQ